MRFMQLKHDQNAVVKKKLIKSGKKWVVVSTLSFVGLLLGGAVTGLDVHADAVGTSDTTSSDLTTTSNPNDDSKQVQSVTANVTISSNMGDVTVNNVTGNVGQTLTVNVPAKAGYRVDKSTVVANVNANGTITTNESINYTATELENVQDGVDPNGQNPADSDNNVTEESKAVAIPVAASAQVTPQPAADSEPATTTNNLDDGGQFGTSKWYIDGNKTLHIGAGELGTPRDTYWYQSQHRNEITSVKIDKGVVANVASSDLFSNLISVTSIDGIENLDTSNAARMYSMFINDKKLTTLDLSKWDTSNVTNTQSMFNGMTSLKSLDVSSFDTSKDNQMANMFNGMTHLQKLNLSSFNTGNVTDMSYMFSGDSSLEELIIDPDKFNTSNVITMAYMFKGMTKLKNIDTSKFDTSKVRSTFEMFDGDAALKSLDLSSFDTRNLAGQGQFVNGMFSGTNLYEIKFNEYTGSNFQAGLDYGDWQAVGAGTESNKISGLGIMNRYEKMPAVTETYVRPISGPLLVPTSYSDGKKGEPISSDISVFPGDKFTTNVTVPAVKGYTPYKNGTEKLIANTDGNYTALISGTVKELNDFTATDSILYKKDIQTATGELEIPTTYDDKKQTGFLEIPEVSGVYGSNDNSVDISSYPIPANYTTDTKSVGYSVDADGKITANDKILYKRLQATPQDLTVTTHYNDGTPDGQITIPNVTGSYGSTDDAYDISTYTPQTGYSTTDNTIPISIDSQGNITTTGVVNYTKNAPESIIADVTIKTSQGPQVVKDVKGVPGKTIQVDVPPIEGYTPDKTQVTVTVNDDGITVNDPDVAGYVTYTKNPTSNGGATTPTSTITDVNIDVATFADQPAARLYDSNGNLITNRALQPNTGWFADKKLSKNGISYYRVATDEWVKMDDVYVYTPNNKYVETYNDSSKDVFNAHQKQISRQLRSDSDWITDVYTYMNGTKYYRISSNEFVSANDAFEYTPVNAIVQTNNYNTTVYDEYGNAVTNRQLAAKSSWKTDKTATINGQTMYRVATNEWIKATDVSNVKEQ
ncbi:BspA family leucine-rich repeat surface protein [Companilactobacillus nodensis]|nr:BspA family leucine-rich repeat surface protein [Companilactobacillus nodensis]